MGFVKVVERDGHICRTPWRIFRTYGIGSVWECDACGQLWNFGRPCNLFADPPVWLRPNDPRHCLCCRRGR